MSWAHNFRPITPINFEPVCAARFREMEVPAFFLESEQISRVWCPDGDWIGNKAERCVAHALANVPCDQSYELDIPAAELPLISRFSV